MTSLDSFYINFFCSVVSGENDLLPMRFIPGSRKAIKVTDKQTVSIKAKTNNFEFKATVYGPNNYN